MSNSRLWKRVGTSQPEARPELRFISQPKGIPVSDTQDYVWVDGGGRGVTVYVVDSGAYPGNSEFFDMPGSKRWLKPVSTSFPSQLTETDEAGHGSCVISKVAGPHFGVAKNVDIVVAKVAIDINGSIWNSSILDMLSVILRDVIKECMQGKAVINISINSPAKQSSGYVNSLRILISQLLKNDVVVVVTSGNGRVSYLSVLCHWFSPSVEVT